jgi:hypothetical protein
LHMHIFKTKNKKDWCGGKEFRHLFSLVQDFLKVFVPFSKRTRELQNFEICRGLKSPVHAVKKTKTKQECLVVLNPISWFLNSELLNYCKTKTIKCIYSFLRLFFHNFEIQADYK